MKRPLNRFRSTIRKALIAYFLAAQLAGCGRYGPPLPPEALSPKGIKELKTSADGSGLTMSWESPDTDRRAQELKSLDGYSVYRKEIKEKSDVVDPDVTYELVGSVVDTSVTERERLRDEAKAAGKLSHRVHVDKALTQFQFSDRGLTPGHTYVYKIIPTNQGGVEGEVKQLVKILFRGETSEISLLDNKQLEDELVLEDPTDES